MGLYQDTKVTYKKEYSGLAVHCVKMISVTGVIKAEQPIASKRSDRLRREREDSEKKKRRWRENKRRKMEER